MKQYEHQARLAELLLAVSLLVLPSVGWSQTKEKATTPSADAFTPEQRQRNLDSFEFVWRTVRDKHWDPKFNGVNWQAVHDELRPEMDKATSSAECREVLNKMIHRLGQSHFSIIPQAAYREIDKGNKGSSGAGVPGFEVRLVEGEPLVVKVQEGQPAAKLGVRTGWQVVRINGQDLAPALKKIRENNKNASLLDHQLYLAVAGRLRGNAGDKLPVVFLDSDGKEVSLAVPLAQPVGVPAQFGNLPAFYVACEGRKLDGNIAYFSLNAFFDPVRVMKMLGDTVKGNLNAEGFVIDLRGNPGGIGGMAMGFGGWFVSTPNQKLGTLFTREGSLKFALNPRAETFNGPLAILVDGNSASTSEILAGGLQDLKRAKVFGMRTAGAALPSAIVRLSNGDGFQYAFANYISEGGQALEARGVHPDVEVPLSRKSLLKGEDPVLNAAVEWIHSQKKSGTTPQRGAATRN